MASRSTYWRVGQLLSIAVMFTAFFAVVPYLGSDPIDEVSPSVAAQMPAGCPAVFTNHAQYSCFWQGPLRDHPVRFSLIAASLLIAWGFLTFASLSGRGFPLRKRRQ